MQPTDRGQNSVEHFVSRNSPTSNVIENETESHDRKATTTVDNEVPTSVANVEATPVDIGEAINVRVAEATVVGNAVREDADQEMTDCHQAAVTTYVVDGAKESIAEEAVAIELSEKGDADHGKKSEKGDADPEKKSEKGDADPEKKSEKGDADLEKKSRKGDADLEKKSEKRDADLEEKKSEKRDADLEEKKSEKGDADPEKKSEKGDADPEKKRERGDADPEKKSERGDADLEKKSEKGDADPEKKSEKGDADPEKKSEKGDADLEKKSEKGDADPEKKKSEKSVEKIAGNGCENHSGNVGADSKKTEDRDVSRGPNQDPVLNNDHLESQGKGLVEFSGQPGPNNADVQSNSESVVQQAVEGEQEVATECPDRAQNDGFSTDLSSDKPVKYKCPKCARVMKDKRLIDNHSCDVDAEEEKVKISIALDKDKKTFVCQECDYANTGHGFEEHLMCHLMVRPYQCLYCKECFINRKEISRHVLKSHNGAKMSCALRALRKAKALMKEVTNCGSIHFMAKVAGKVPLEKDPEKKKKSEELAETQSGEKDPNPLDQTLTGPEMSVRHQGFSRLREVLTSGSTCVTSKGRTEELGGERSSKGRDSQISVSQDNVSQVNESGLKIVNSYSLHQNQTQKGESAAEEPPNFINASSVEQATEAEVLSFLGPDQAIVSSLSSRIPPPPPLQLAPSHSLPGSVHLQPTPALPSAVQPGVRNPHFFVCGFNCLFSTLSTSDFKEHTVNFHSTETYFPCYHCGHRSPNENDLVRHISNHTHTHNKTSPLYVCGNDGCRFGTNMVTDYISHIKLSHPEITEPLCYSCGETFPDAAMLQLHAEENVIHIVNCPHCSSKANDRSTILKHISAAHPGKPKMVSVAKQLICHDRKLNDYEQMKHLREMLPPTLTPAPSFASGASVIDQILSRQDVCGSSSLSEMLSTRIRNSPSPSAKLMSSSSRSKLATADGSKSPASECSEFDSVRVKEEMDADEGLRDSPDEISSTYAVDENGVRRRIYVPMSERQAENYRCKHCTFIARDLKRLHCHERSHGMPPTRKERFKCMFCPQGFDSEMKFRLHITCHPGLIKFLLYRCKKCEFDTNQKHTIVRHITCNRDRKHRGFGPIEDQYTLVSRSLESRVLECERCDYMTRHKIHMAIHYQREHNILRDKGEFSIEGLTPTDTPLSTYDNAPQEQLPSPAFQMNVQSPDGCSNSLDAVFDFTRPTGSAKKSKDRALSEGPLLTVTQITERNELFKKMVSQQAALQPGQVLENQMRKFKCPICKYLLPKAADLKNHVKRHSEIGHITLVMFRCKYCSCMSTARELLYDHLNEKHPGKPIALVKKIVAIDTTEVDKSFAETSMEESLDQLEESLHKEIMSTLNSATTPSTDGQAATSSSSSSSSSSSYEQLFVIPEGGETFSAELQCPKCPFSSFNKSEIVAHVTALHAEVKVIGSDEDVDNLAKATTEDLQTADKKEVQEEEKEEEVPKPFSYQEEVLIVPDDQIFKEPALCSRCDFNTTLRREMVLHLQQNHPEISVMGRNSYPVQVAAMGKKVGSLEESCVVGSGSLDAKIRCLYENYGTSMKCLICGTERPKKFFIHVHILRHLNIYLWKCAFCAHRGLQKYKMVDHIKKIHPGRPMSVRYLRVNVDAKVSQFLAQFNIIKNRKASLDGGLEVDEMMDQTSSDSNRSRQKSPVLGGMTGSQCPNALGGDELDEKINCLYDFSDGVFYKCRTCPNQFQRKFAVHRHIIITHLKLALLACSYCGMEGVEKHQMVDHILACHKPQPISIQTLDVDIGQKVSVFLDKMAAGEMASDKCEASKMSNSSANTSEFADEYYNRLFRPYAEKKPKSVLNKFSKAKSSLLKFGNKTAGEHIVKKTNAVDPDVIMLGRAALDKELSCLYQERPYGQLRCLVCRWEFPRKYPLHRHIMLKHLKMNLVGCPYCPFQGVEKYNVSTHIKEEHKDKPINIKYTQPDVRSRVRQFVDDTASFGGKIQDLIKRPSSGDHSPLIVPKIEKTDEELDGNDDDNEDKKGSSGEHFAGLVVAMFGKKTKSSLSGGKDNIVVKMEVVNEEYEEGSALHSNEEDASEHEEDYNEDEDPGADKSTYDPSDDSVSSFSSLKRPLLESYAPGSYRSPAGGKPKALDVITKIKVLKSREGPITKFYCEKCKFTSLHRSNIVRHIYKIHEKYQTHTCPVCNYQTLSLMLMQKHMEKEHPGVEYKEDSFTLNPPRSKPRSKPIMGPLSFQRRRQDLLRKKLAASAESSSNNAGPKQYACAYCHYETNTQEDILQHTRDNHSQSYEHFSVVPTSLEDMSSTSEDVISACWDGSKKAIKRKVQEQDGDIGMIKRKRRFVFEKGDELIQCGHCDTRETSMARMQDHLTWDHPGLPFHAKRIPAWRFVCKSCAVKTMATSKMKYHLNRHVNYRPYTCVNCGAFFPSPDQCRRHSRAQGHEEQYTYVRNPKKEARVEELLEATRQLALTIQVEAAKDPEFDIAQMDAFISRFQDSGSNLKRSAPVLSGKSPKKSKDASDTGEDEEDGPQPKKQFGKSAQTLGIEQDITIKCYQCEFTAANVSDVSTHHKEAHEGEKFLWTELDRGFTCDVTGEALPECDTVPSSSSDVGYTTRMTLGIGSNTMRFKCKNCDFSSCVIQAMKSHLKSHQPKGFICPYCSRSFSGKEKLMRHQYCLHKGQPLWVIHLRRSGVAGSTNVKKCKAASMEETVADSKTEEVSPSPEELKEKEKDLEFLDPAKLMRLNPSPTTYHCSECRYTTGSLFHFRLHLAQQHEEGFKYKVQDTSVDSLLKCGYCPFLAETESDLNEHIETHFSSRSFQCGYCDYTAYEHASVEHHLASDHSSLESKILDLGPTCQIDQECVKGQERKEMPLLLNLMPDVAVERISDSVLSQYGCTHVQKSDYSEEEDEDEEGMACERERETQLDIEAVATTDSDEGGHADEEQLMVVGGGSMNCAVEEEETSRRASSDTAVGQELEHQLALAEQQIETDMMIIQFGGIGSHSTVETRGGKSETENSEASADLSNFPTDSTIPAAAAAITRSKDSTLFSAQEKDENDDNDIDDDNDDDDDDEEVNFDNDITLASPLPMISLGDSVAMSPVTLTNSEEAETV